MTATFILLLLVVTIPARTAYCTSTDDSRAVTRPSSRPDYTSPVQDNLDAIAHASDLLKAGKAREAVAEASRFIDSASGTIEEHHLALHLRAMALLSLDQPDEALRDTQSIIDSKRATADSKRDAWRLRLSIHQHTQDPKAVVDDATQYLAMTGAKDTRRAWVALSRASACQKMGRFPEALRDCNDALGSAGLTSEERQIAYFIQATVLLQTHKFKEAAEDYTRVAESADATDNLRKLARDALDLLKRGATTLPESGTAKQNK